tara:strand:+ start:48 stop:737 length:690 start_codon:yes stop_codon:yes gene_type:complete
MALQLRRGTDAERSAVTFADGELVYTTDTKKLYVGDGATAGGNSITALTNTLDGDLTGSVFGDDSTLIVDGINNSINTSNFNTTNNKINIEGLNDDHVDLTFVRNSLSDISSTNLTYGKILFNRHDTNGSQTSAAITGAKEILILAIDDGTNAFPVSHNFCLDVNGLFGVGTLDPIAKLDVRGPIKPGVYADNAARDADITTPVAGMIIFNTTGTKFQGYNGSAWVNLN